MATMYISKITPLGSSTTYNIKDLEAIQSIATGDNNGQIKITPRSGNAYNVSVKGLGSNAYTSTAYLPLAGGTMTGSITFNKQANAIAYTGTKQTYNMIKFKDNTADTYGNGIIIGGGGLAVIGGGESADTIAATHTSGGDEVLDLTSDGNVYVWTGVQSGAESAKKFTFNQDGTFDSPGAIKVNGTPVLTAHQTVTNKNATLAWSTTSTIATIGSTDIKITMPANPDTHHTAYIRAGASGGTANAATTTGNTYLNLVENNTNRSGVKLVPGSNMEITSDANGNVTFKATDTTYSSKTAASGGTEVSLVTTGEKYIWNSKADGNHTHATSLATDTGTSAITLAYGGKYKLTTGGTSVIFTMPADSNVDTKVTQNNTTTNSDYRILLSTSANDDAETNTINKNTNLRYNPSTNTLSTGNITGTGNLNVIGNTDLNGETYAASVTTGSLLVNGNTNFVQIPTAPTPAATSNDTSVATTAFVMNAFTANDAMVFKGVVNANGDLPATHKQGWTYRIATAGTYAGKVCEVGDIIICVTDGTAANNDHWAVIQNNVDGAVYRGTNAFTDANIIVADNTAGKVKSSGTTITTTAPSSTAADTTVPTSKAVWSAISGASGYGKTGTVTSIRVQATSPVVSSSSAASSSTLDTTISLADGYGDTKNPYASKTANYVLAGPSSGNAAAPSFRKLVAADIPSLTKSKISDFPTDVSAFTNDVGYLTSFTETDPTVPAWAKASSKPSYTASEVGLGNVTNAAQITKSTFTKAYQIMYSTAASTPAVLDANTTATKKFLRMTGTGSAGAAPAWDTVTKSDVGLGNVENTKLSTWAGSSNITTIGTLSSGTVPWARLSGVPSSFTPSSHTHNLLVTEGDNRTVATTPNDYSNKIIFRGLKTNSSFNSPSTDTYSYVIGLRGWSDSSGGDSHELAFNNTGLYWRHGATTSWGNWARIYTTANKPTKSDVGLGNVENTALSTWTGSSNITTIGTLSSGTVPWARLSNIPSSFTPSAHTHYWANVETTSAAAYNTAPEMATLKLNGNTSASAASTSNVTLVFDATLQALNFVFA